MLNKSETAGNVLNYISRQYRAETYSSTQIGIESIEEEKSGGKSGVGNNSAAIAAGLVCVNQEAAFHVAKGVRQGRVNRVLRGETRPLEVQRRERVRANVYRGRVLANLPELRRH